MGSLSELKQPINSHLDMPKLPFELISAEANKLLDKAISSKTEEEIHEAYDIYMAFLEAAGWSVAEFDDEALKRIDEGWKDIPVPNAPKPKSIKELN